MSRTARRFRSRTIAVLAAACLLLYARTAIAQDASPPPAASPAQTSPAETPVKPTYTLRERVPITILDVVVTDAKGRPVHGLKQSDFTILEDKQPMHPNSFEEHRSDAPQPAAPAPRQNLPPNTFTNDAPVPSQPTPLVILLFDPLNIQVSEQQIIRKRMLDFADKLPPGTRTAVLNLYATLSIVQGFTPDRGLLREAILPKKFSPTISPLEDPFQDPLNRDPRADIDPPDAKANAQNKAVLVDRQGDAAAYRAQYELSALNQIARYLSGIPGRKNLIWFTGSFPMQFPPVPDDQAFPPPPGEMVRSQSYDFEPQMHAALDLLARAHVAVYPVDGRGLQVPLMPSFQTPLSAAPGSTQWQAKNDKFTLITEHLTMEAIAEQTGGKAFYNTNDLAAAAQQAIDLGSNFYTITYTPTNQNLDTRFRTISVKTDQPNLHLDYRNGYYALAPNVSLQGVNVPRPTPLQAAMLRGAPELNEILFDVKVVRLPGTEQTLPADNQRSASEMKPPYRRYHLDYTTHVDRISYQRQPGGNYLSDFEFVVVVYDNDSGKAFNSTTMEVRPIVPASTYESMLKEGATAFQEIDVPAKGSFFLRIGVHDVTTDHVGALEIPVSSITTAPAQAQAVPK